MHKIFHEKITVLGIVFLLLELGLTFFLGWQKNILGILTLMLLIFTLERLLYSQYVITADGKLLINHGRFAKKRIISLNQVLRVERGNYLLGMGKYLVLVMNDGSELGLRPDREQEFLDYLKKKQQHDE